MTSPTPEHVHLQRRVALFAAVAALLVGGHYVFINGLRTLGGDKPWSDWLNPTALTHLGTALCLALLWGVIRQRPSSTSFLAGMDAAVCLIFVAGITAVGVSAWDSHAPEMVILTGGSLALVARATLVPSTPQRTALVGAFGAAIMVAGAYAVSALRQGESHGPAYYAAIAASWAVLAVVAATIASGTIYGLRREVAAARQLGPYLLGEPIGEGAMGVVYEAQHRLLKRPTAVKLLRPELVDARTRERFRREILLTARLEHPSTVAVYDTGETRDGALYYAMELLDGVDLRTLVARHGPLSPARAIHLLRQACLSLAEAHEAGLIHRDVKPSNMMLCRRGGLHDVLKVLDFGLVKESTPDATSPEVSSETLLVGTPLYMAPEAIESPASVSPATDLYALGATAYFLLTARHAFVAGDRDEVLRKQLSDPPEPPSRHLDAPLPPDLEALLLQCLNKRAGDRPESARALERALRDCADAGGWTEADAAEWWQQHLPERRQLTAGTLDDTTVVDAPPSAGLSTTMPAAGVRR